MGDKGGGGEVGVMGGGERGERGEGERGGLGWWWALERGDLGLKNFRLEPGGVVVVLCWCFWLLLFG